MFKFYYLIKYSKISIIRTNWGQTKWSTFISIQFLFLNETFKYQFIIYTNIYWLVFKMNFRRKSCTHRFVAKIPNTTGEIGSFAYEGRDIGGLRIVEWRLEFRLQPRRVIEHLLSGSNLAWVPLYTAHCTVPQTQSICKRRRKLLSRRIVLKELFFILSSVTQVLSLTTSRKYHLIVLYTLLSSMIHFITFSQWNFHSFH